jgi:hypothetical protein
MSRIKFWLLSALILAGLTGAVIVSPAQEEQIRPCPMPLHRGTLAAGIFRNSAPEPHREDAVKKYLIPSVRIRVPGSAGSGTICAYDKKTNTAYVISCAHLYNGVNKPTTIEVFYKNEQKLTTPARYTATVISFKVNYYGDDISIMSFKPDWEIDTWFPIAPLDRPIPMGETFFSCGCDHAGEVACYFVKTLGFDGVFLATRENSPRPGRSGGGLIDKDGWYIGICVRTSDVSGNGTGYFVTLRTIHDYCRQNNLAWLLSVDRPNHLLRSIPIVDRVGNQGNYPSNYVPVP